MTQAGIETITNGGHFRDRLDREPKLAPGNIPADGGKIPIWRLDLEPPALWPTNDGGRT